MNASYEWLRAIVPVDASPQKVRDLITAHTAPVDELVPMRTDLAPIVVARVVEASPHPDSDHLWFTKVDNGSGEILEVICGAPNVKAGKLYPFAAVGTTMPNGMKIERRKIRGIVSNGMLCSAKELLLGENHDGILELTVEAAPGTPFLKAMPVGDMQLVIDVGANRPDLLSHIGLARELATVTGLKWGAPDLPGIKAAPVKVKSVKKQGAAGGIAIRVDDDTKTRRYIALVIRGVTVGPSPDWLVRRLATMGSRSINNVVDATNYVLHEYGQPIHAFDLARLKGGITVRLARAKESLVTLDGQARSLPAGAVVIADDERPQAVAGVMGGKDSEVSQSTRDLLIEVASFDPSATRRTRRALGLSTDASYRFERGVDSGDAAVTSLARVASVIIGLAGGTIEGAATDIVGQRPASPELTLSASRVKQVLGEAVPMKAAAKFLTAAGFGVKAITGKPLKVRVPSWRSDVTREIDLVEEVARFHGYDKFPDEIRPFRPTTTFDDPLWTLSARIRELLAGRGLLEARPMPFVKGGDDTHVRVGNPLSEEEAYLRTGVCESLARRAEHNLAHRTGDVRLFEIGSVFTKTKSAMPDEFAQLGILIMGRVRPPHFTDPEPPMLDEWDAKELAEASARVSLPGKEIALVPSTDDRLWTITAAGTEVGRVWQLQLDAPIWAGPSFGIEMTLCQLDSKPAALPGQHHYMEGGPKRYVLAAEPGSYALVGGETKLTFKPPPTMPPVEIDLALLVPKATTVADVERVIRAAAGDLLERLELFDQYTGAGIDPEHRSLAWRLTFRHHERTLRDKEIEGRRGKIVSALEQELHVRQRTA